MEELMAELEADGGMDAFDKLLDKAASDVAEAHKAELEGGQHGGVGSGSDGSGDSSQAVLLSNQGSETGDSVKILSATNSRPSPVLLSDADSGWEAPSSPSERSGEEEHCEASAPPQDSSASPQRLSSLTRAQNRTQTAQPASQGPASVPPQQQQGQQQQPREVHEGQHDRQGGGSSATPLSSLGGLFASAVASAKASASDMMFIEHQGIGATVNTLLSSAGEELYYTTTDVAAAARSGNTRLLIKPQASFGVPLELIASRECGDQEAEVCPEIVDGVLSIMEEHHEEHGRLSAQLFCRHLTREDKQRLHHVREAIDNGAPLTQLDLGEDRVASAADLLRWFLLELPQPLLGHALYDDFVRASRAGEGAMSDVAQRMQPPHRATARRILSFLNRACVQDAPNKQAQADRLAASLGPLVLRCAAQEVVMVMSDVISWRAAVSMCIRKAEGIFAHSCWFLGPWLGVYSLECVGVFASPEAADGWLVKGGVGSVSEVEFDAAGIVWAGHRAKAGSEVNASHWERNRDEREYHPSMVVAAKFDTQTVMFAFAGKTPHEGLENAEQIVIEDDGNGGLQERVLRRFEGRYMKPLRWEALLDRWAAESVGGAWDDRKHPMAMQELWILTYPEDDPPTKEHEDWRRLGFSSKPSEDFGDAGMLLLDLLLSMGEHHNPKYKGMVLRSQGASERDSYPFAQTAARLLDGLLVTLRLLGEGTVREVGASWEACGKQVLACRRSLGMLLAAKEEAFSDVFATALLILDDEWTASRRSAASLDTIVLRASERAMAALRTARPDDIVGAVSA
eukprot:CAMPEP_0114113132 /NCGR_PEP_ID=MMETSP0043_2-20121206/2751_1 /TAXON_ID=464988 /ORGANISM="Hemiselmis andersenii, Strain CCMP644" /LENGTH=797 /DNA_ID=CAMNT_0001205265 /DNA_START=103 /DNA_END=2496 /DNA_ORIENTATION=-